MKNKKKPRSFPYKTTLLTVMVLAVFLILLISQLIAVGGIYLCLTNGIISLNQINPFITMVIYLLLISSIFGLILTTVAGKICLRPLRRFIDTTKKVAAGDFSVRFQLGGLEESNQLILSLNTMIEELGGIETLRDDFVSNISHEFKTPIASIHGFAKLLKKGNLTKEQQDEYLDIILSESERLSTLSKNVLLLSKLDNTTRLEDLETYPLDEQLRRTILVLNQEIERKEIDLDVNMDTCQIQANKEMLSQVWINLLNNAIKFTSQRGRIEVNLKNAGDVAVVTFRDNGIGMGQETLKNIFDKFYQEDSSRSCEGNGLGLALVKRIVTLSGGKIDVTSQTGNGSEFRITLPLATRRG